MRVLNTKRFGIAGASLLACAAAWAGSATYDFNGGVPAGLDFVGNAEWRATGGVNNSGYMSLFDSINSQHASVLIPDFDQGLIVKAFTFEVDLRVGNAIGNGGRPADGFSVSYARANDPVVLDLEAGTDNLNNFAVAGGPENGTKTGIAISFDTWSGNTLPDGADLEGIIVRVDNVTKARIPMPTRNGSCTDATSLQTGPWDGTDSGVPDGLCWAPLKVVLAENGELTVTWKNVNIVTNLQTGFSPSAGRMVFAGRTGGANENTHIDNLKITTIPSDKALFSGVNANAEGYAILIDDSGQSVYKDGSATIKIDGAAVTPTGTSKTGNTTTISVKTAPNWLASGSTHSVEVSFQDTLNNTLGGTKSVTVAAYASITAAMKVTGVSTAAANRGFLVRTHQVDTGQGNDNVRTERQLFGEIGANQMEMSVFDKTIPGTANKYVLETEYINYDQDGADQGMFTGFAADPQRAAPEKQLPGLPSLLGNTDNMALEALCFLEFPAAGLYTFGVNSDDGFRVYAGRNPFDRFQVDSVMLGEFSGGRGTDANGPQSLFSFLVAEAGIYPVRFTWEEGGGGANMEWYQQLANGSLALINDTTRAAGVVKAYWDGPRTGRAYIAKVVPGVGPVNAQPNTKIEATISDDGTAVVDGSVKLTVNGTAVTPAVTKTGKNTLVSYTPAAPLNFGATVNVTLIFSENSTPVTIRTQAWSFAVRSRGVADLPANSFTIDAEHFDYNGGQAMISAGTGYTGAEYDQLSATLNVDYSRNDTVGDSDLYRVGESPNVPMDSQTDAGTLDVQRPGFEVTTNYKMGWTGNGFWYNYTRTIPQGIYTAYAAQSHGDANADVGGWVEVVTAGAGTTTQTTSRKGHLTGPAPGGWGSNALVPMIDGAGNQSVFKLPGGKTTVRYVTRNGDFDWFTLSPVTGISPKITQAPSGVNTLRSDATLTWYLENFNTSVQAGSVKFELDGTDMTSAATLAATTDGTTITYKLPGASAAGSRAYKISWTDSASKADSYSGTLLVGPLPAPNVFVIEAEDFNYDGGKANPKKGTADRDVDVMPYKGGAYDGLSAVAGVDYASTDGGDSDLYRKNENPNKSMDAVLGNRFSADRGTWNVDVNYKLGWTDSGDWGNYTRTIPAGNYEVWAALSHSGRDANQLNATMGTVKSDITKTNQVVAPLGKFSAPGSGDWGANNLVPMVDDSSVRQVIKLGGPETIRFRMGSGDFDFLALVQTAAPAAKARIAWVSFHGAAGSPTTDAANAGFTQAPDVEYTKLLSANGYNVTRIVTSGTPDVATLNTFDLVIISRSVPSGDYQDPPETLAWNGVTAPTLLLNGYILRNSRLGFVTGANLPDTAGPLTLSVKQPTHPIFAGVTIGADGTMANPYANLVTYNGTVQRGVSVNTDPIAAGGTVLATSATAGDPTLNGTVIAEWPAGAKMSNAAGDILGGRRVVLLTGSREQGITSQAAGIYDLTADGAKVFLNAVAYLTPQLGDAPKFTSIKLQGGNVTIEWTGGGTLQSATAITGPWTDVAGAVSPLTVPASEKIIFARIKK